MEQTPTTAQILRLIGTDFKSVADPSRKLSTQQFFKRPVKCYGVNVPTSRIIGKRYLPMLKNQPKEYVFAVCERLWKSGMMEESIIACQYSYAIRKSFESGDMLVFERWLSNYVNNWASCDTFCNHTIGEFLETYTEYLTELYKWAQSSNRWMRRAAAVSLIIPAGKGKFLDPFLNITLVLLKDPDDLVQKGYGWLLKSASTQHPKKVFNFVMTHKAEIPRSALRYAIEKLSPTLKKRAMA